jgi:tripartite ATP-independent transporter DctM subunit
LLYAAAVSIWMRFAPELGPAGNRASWRERFSALGKIWGVVAIFTVVMGGIMAGLFSPTEGAAVGSFCAIVLGFAQRRLTLSGLVGCLLETIQVSAMILFVVAGVSIFDYFIQAAQIGPLLSDFVRTLDIAPFWIMALIIVILIGFGMVLDTMAILFILTPVLYPIVMELGYDPIWFGILMIMLIEIGLITPPIGMNIFVVAKMVPQVTTWGAFQGVTPFIVADIVRIALFLLFPGLVLFLPGLMM